MTIYRTLPRAQLRTRSKKEWKKWLTRAATFGRTALQLYIGVKRREPVYVGLGIADVVQAVADWSEEDTNFDIEQEMRSRQLVSLYSENQFMRFFYYTVKQMDLPSRRIAFGTEKAATNTTEWNAVCYNVCGCELYFLFRGTWLEYIYGQDVNAAIRAFSEAVQKHMGQYVALTVTTENWTSYMGLTSLEAHLESYVSPVDLTDFCTVTQKFQSRGLNRAHLLYGPPGTGKTTFASLVARELGERLLVIEGAPLNKIVNYGIQLDKLVDIVQPRVILFDDLDRTDRPEELFGEVERLNRTYRDSNILILGSVNSLKALPKALCREGRFDSIVEFALPDAELRKQILQAHLREHNTPVEMNCVNSVVEWSDGLSGAALRELVLQISVRGYDREFIKERIAHRRQLQKAKDEGENKSVLATDNKIMYARKMG